MRPVNIVFSTPLVVSPDGVLKVSHLLIVADEPVNFGRRAAACTCARHPGSTIVDEREEAEKSGQPVPGESARLGGGS
jgi:hypothetical protein